MSKQSAFFMVLVLMSTVLYGVTNQFVTPKRQKKVSVARLKESIGGTLADSLQNSTHVIEHIGQLQRELMQMTATLFEQAQDSSLTHANRESLTKTLQELTTLQHELEAMNKRIDHQIGIVKKLY